VHLTPNISSAETVFESNSLNAGLHQKFWYRFLFDKI